LFTRNLALMLLAGLGTAVAAPKPFVAKPRNYAPATAAELAKRLNGTYRVVSYEYGNGGGVRGIAVGRATVWSGVVIRDGSWTQAREIGARKYETKFDLKVDASKSVPSLTLTYTGNPVPTFTGVAAAQGNQIVVTLGTRGREVNAPAAELGLGQYRWVLERTGD